MMRLHGIGGDAWKRYSKTGSWFYEVQHAGYKMNLPDLLAAVGVAQLKKATSSGRSAARLRPTIAKNFRRSRKCSCRRVQWDPSEHSWHLFILRLRPELLSIGRDEFIEELKAAGIGTSVHFIPLHHHPYYVREIQVRAGRFPAGRGLLLALLSRCPFTLT